LDDKDKIQFRLPRALRPRLAISGIVAVCGFALTDSLTDLASTAFSAGLGVGILSFALWISARFLHSELFRSFLWFGQFILYLLILEHNGLWSKGAIELLPFFLSYTGTVVFVFALLQTFYDSRLQSLGPMP